MTANKMGRPPSENPKNKKLTIRVTESEMSIIDECAKRLGITKSELAMNGIKLVCDLTKKDNQEIG